MRADISRIILKQKDSERREAGSSRDDMPELQELQDSMRTESTSLVTVGIGEQTQGPTAVGDGLIGGDQMRGLDPS